MKLNRYLIAAALLLPAGAYAQQDKDGVLDNEPGVIEQIAKIEKKTDKFNLYFNMHGDFASSWTGNDFDGGKFEFKQFRIEAKGKLNNWLSYRYRQRLTKDDLVGSTDNIFKSIDVAGFGMEFGKWQFFLGKQCAAYGGIEFDLNPIEIYQYSDMVDYMSNFLTGVNIAYNFTPNQQLQFQVLDALNESSKEKYGAWKPSKLPLVYTLNWNGNFNDVYKTRWSASIMNETRNKYMYYFALGNDFNITDRFQMYFDWMYSIENVDRKGIITDIVGKTWKNGGEAMNTDTEYMSFILHANYRFHPKWNIFGKFMYEMEGVSKNHEMTIFDAETETTSTHEVQKGLYRTALGYIGGVEFYPFKDRNLHFFLTYVGRGYQYSKKAQAYGMPSYANTNKVSLGFIWQMPVF